MTSNFYTNSYIKNHEKEEIDKEIDRERTIETVKLLKEMLNELKLVVCSLDKIEKVVNR